MLSHESSAAPTETRYYNPDLCVRIQTNWQTTELKLHRSVGRSAALTWNSIRALHVGLIWSTHTGAIAREHWTLWQKCKPWALCQYVPKKRGWGWKGVRTEIVQYIVWSRENFGRLPCEVRRQNGINYNPSFCYRARANWHFHFLGVNWGGQFFWCYCQLS